MVKPRRFFHGARLQSATLILLSILVGAGTYLYLLNYQSQIKETNRLQPIYVATSEIPSGTSFGEIISTSLLEIRELPAAAIPLGAIGPSSQIENSLRSRGVLSPGQIMVASFFSSEARSDTGLPIPKGKLAITISVDDVARVGNFVSPGSRVVVFATSTTNSGTAQTRILLPEVLVIGIGDATKFLQHIVAGKKKYLATIRLGVTTTTDDCEGAVLEERDCSSIQDLEVSQALAHFVGQIEQVPSSVSAIKVQGRRAYDLVREGKAVELKARTVEIQKLQVLGIRRTDGLEVDIEVTCSAGTYIRAIARDLGRALGVGGHLTSLRRTLVAPFTLSRQQV